MLLPKHACNHDYLMDFFRLFFFCFVGQYCNCWCCCCCCCFWTRSDRFPTWGIKSLIQFQA
ncbi:hypothetical protein P168DRAFT_138444 [Aspergillus campestris IBT 28561]|uniref:Uncharacterized protein n=1 Tax=Aspergillus campestris (strain IBT 28561) TaxID=1392248 RepID=A0A2I1D4G2_ASPC2|nr:uncharacterized protein P168DRAFT_138444 [Aspergillus campestris IBT 28561]PKY04756.1 hypothetical protein P168DRAFT_138444 [Aspergillus campestris IBT 28561]